MQAHKPHDFPPLEDLDLLLGYVGLLFFFFLLFLQMNISVLIISTKCNLCAGRAAKMDGWRAAVSNCLV